MSLEIKYHPEIKLLTRFFANPNNYSLSQHALTALTPRDQGQGWVFFFRNSFTGRSVGTVPTRESTFGTIRSPVEVFMCRKRGENWLIGLFVPLGSAPRPPILAQIWIFLAQNLGNYVGAHPPFELGCYLNFGASHSGFSETGRKS